jgi:putative ABC transport system permease protein
VLSLFTRFRSLWCALIDRSRFERDMDEEFRVHLEQRTDDLVRLDMPSREAVRRARLEFGNPQTYRDECRQSRGLRLVDDLGADLRYAVRNIRAHALLSITVVVTLAGGIGISTGVFSLISAVALRSHVSSDPASFVRIFTSSSTDPARRPVPADASLDEYLAFKATARSLRALAAYHRAEASIGGDDGTRRRVLLASCDVFPIFGPEPAALGRLLVPQDCESNTPVVVLSDFLWRDQFGADPGLVGTSVRINGRPATVVGVAQPRLAAQVDGALAWLPYTTRSILQAGSEPLNRIDSPPTNDRWLNLAGRLAPGVSRPSTTAELNLLAAQLDRVHPGQSTTVIVTDGAEVHKPGAATRIVPIVAFIMGVVMCLVLVACANVTTLLLSRADARQREMAVRLSLGAGRMRLVRMLLTETLLLASISGVASVYLAHRVPVVLRDWLVKRPLEFTVDPDWRVFAYLMMLTVAAGVAAGLAPAAESLRVDLVESLKDRTRLFGVRRDSGLRPYLVGVQVALSVVLLTGAGMFVLQHYRLRTTDPGYDTRQVLMPLMTPKRSLTRSTDSSTAFHEAIVRRSSGLPGVQSVAFASSPPVFEPDGVDVTIRDKGIRRAAVNEVSPQFFSTVGVRILEGRALETSDAPCGSLPCNVVVSETFVRAHLPSRDAIGQRFVIGTLGQAEVVGIAAATRAGTLLTGYPIVYTPWIPGARKYQPLLRFRGEPRSFAAAVTAAFREINSESPVQARTLQQMIDDTADEVWRLEVLVVVVGSAAMALAVIGVYGVVAFSVSRRTREIGIRIALGARRADVYASVFGSSLPSVGAGVVGGVLLSTVTASILARMTHPGQFGIDPSDPTAYIVMSMLLVGIIVLAISVPAHRAARIAPLEALRED